MTQRSPISQDALEIFHAGVDAVRPKALVENQIRCDPQSISIAGQTYDRRSFDRVIVVGAGKAATEMTAGLHASLADQVPIIGWVNVPEGTERRIGDIRVHPARPMGVNEPTEAAVQGTREILSMVSNATERDLCVALISGGGSALMPLPIEGISLDDKLQVIRHLSGAGANIAELNTVRKHLSGVKGGGLLAACRKATLVTLVLSDVLGDPLDLIASGPTVPDPSSPVDALRVLGKFDPSKTLPASVYAALQSATENQTYNTDHQAGFPTIVIGNNALAVDSAAEMAKSKVANVVSTSASECEGVAENIGEGLARQIIEVLRGDSPRSGESRCIISGGEPTVELADPSVRGLGGRNQQLVLAAYRELRKAGLRDDQWDRVVLISGGTDGEDGPTDAAGAILDARVHRQATELKLDLDESLNRNDAYHFFKACGGLLKTGPTGTNVCDIRIALIHSAG